MQTRKKYVNFVDSVKGSGGSAHIFSSLHVSGERKFHPLWPNFSRHHLSLFIFHSVSRSLARHLYICIDIRTYIH